MAVLTAAVVIAPSAAFSAAPDWDQVVTVRFAPGTSGQERSDARRSVVAVHEHSLDGPQLQQIAVSPGHSPDAAARVLERRDDVVYAVPPGTWSADAVDPFFASQWSLKNTGQVFMTRLVAGDFQQVSGTAGADINAPAAWDAVSPAQRANDVRIGVVDTGVAYQHVDLADNMLLLAGAKQDFYDGDADPRDYNGHGTHVASIAAAVSDNGIGTRGVDPWAKVLPLRAGDDEGTFNWNAIDQAVQFGLANDVRVFNGSFGGPESNQALEDLMAGSADRALFIFSAGNGGADQVGDDHDAPSGVGHRFPCDSGLDNVICVGASDWNDAITSFSDYGPQSVDLLAPGAGVYAARPCSASAVFLGLTDECPEDALDPMAPVGLAGGTAAFQLMSGTSMAAPAVSGAAALLWQKCPALSPAQIKRAIVTTVHPLPAVRTKVAYGGRLDLAAATQFVGDCSAVPTGWPVPPAQPAAPGGEGGGSTGGGGPTAPAGGLPATGTSPAPRAGLTFRIVRPSSAKVRRTSKVTFKLRCSQICSGHLTVRPIARGVTFKQFKVKIRRAKAGTRKISVKIPRSSLKAVRALLAGRSKVRLRFSAVITDADGVDSRPVAFSIRLRR